MLGFDQRPGDDEPEVAMSEQSQIYQHALEAAAKVIAARSGDTPEHILEAWRARQFGAADMNADRDAWARLEVHIGAVDAGFPTGANNEQIDADLARA